MIGSVLARMKAFARNKISCLPKPVPHPLDKSFKDIGISVEIGLLRVFTTSSTLVPSFLAASDGKAYGGFFNKSSYVDGVVIPSVE